MGATGFTLLLVHEQTKLMFSFRSQWEFLQFTPEAALTKVCIF